MQRRPVAGTKKVSDIGRDETEERMSESLESRYFLPVFVGRLH